MIEITFYESHEFYLVLTQVFGLCGAELWRALEAGEVVDAGGGRHVRR
jgi:hypothetical protein